MDSNSDDFDVEEDSSNIQLPLNDSIQTEIINHSQDDSNIYLHSLSESISQQTADHVLELNKYEPSECNPKIELNLLLHNAIRERTLRQLALSKGIEFSNDEQIIAQIFQNDHCLLQRIFQEIVNDQRQQRIIYTEILFRPDIFNFENETANIKLKDIIEVIINCIHSFTSTDNLNDAIDTAQNKTTIKSSISNGINPLTIHIKIILSCNWNNAKSMIQFIRLARTYSQEIVGIDFYGNEDDCRKYWHEFRKYTKILHHYHIRYQASMNNYKDLQLIEDVIEGLNIERLSEAYELVLSLKSMENILIKHAIGLIICPISNDYMIANQQVNNTFKKRKYSLTSSLENSNNEKDFDEQYNLMNYLQSELINYSITSLSPVQHQKNLTIIYKELLENNKHYFTCEYMQWLNENAIKISFASQELKTELMNYIHENYKNCYKQTILQHQFQQTTNY